jgi:hypothetical protein
MASRQPLLQRGEPSASRLSLDERRLPVKIFLHHKSEHRLPEFYGPFVLQFRNRGMSIRRDETVPMGINADKKVTFPHLAERRPRWLVRTSAKGLHPQNALTDSIQPVLYRPAMLGKVNGRRTQKNRHVSLIPCAAGSIVRRRISMNIPFGTLISHRQDCRN